MREDDTILIADMCHNDTALLDSPEYITYKAKGLPKDASIKVDDSGLKFKVQNNDIIYASMSELRRFNTFLFAQY